MQILPCNHLVNKALRKQLSKNCCRGRSILQYFNLNEKELLDFKGPTILPSCFLVSTMFVGSLAKLTSKLEIVLYISCLTWFWLSYFKMPLSAVNNIPEFEWFSKSLNSNMNYLSVAKYDFETTSNVIKNQRPFCSHFFFYSNALIDEKQALK